MHLLEQRGSACSSTLRTRLGAGSLTAKAWQAPGIGRALTELINNGAYQSIDISNMAVERVLGKEARHEPYVL